MDTKKAGLTQQQLADHLLISPTLISKWENDASMPDLDMMDQLANYYHVSVDHILGRDTDKKGCHVLLMNPQLKGAALKSMKDNHLSVCSASASLEELESALTSAPDAKYLIVFSLIELPAHLNNRIHDLAEQYHINYMSVVSDSGDCVSEILCMICKMSGLN